MPSSSPVRSGSVRPSVPSGDPVQDAELRDLIATHLRDRGLKTLEVAVSGGHVTLAGSVTSSYEKQMVVLTVRRLRGVDRLTDQVRIAEAPVVRPSAARRAADFSGDLGNALLGWYHDTPKSAWLLILVAVLAPTTMFSCGPSEVRVPVYPVSGKVTYKGEAAEGAQVVLHAKGHSLPPNTVASGKAGSDGTFKVGTYQTGDGAPAGDYTVTVTWNKVVKTDGGAGPGPNVLPKEYGAADTSKLTVTVKEGQNEIPAIEIK